MINIEDIPASLRTQTFPPTGGHWVISQDLIIELTLGPKVKEHENVVAEALWAESLLRKLKALDHSQKWDAITSLEKLPKQDNPPLAMRLSYARMIKDKQTRSVAMVHATGWNKAITQTFIITMGSSRKVKFFETSEEARKWILSVR